jgi:hypothetical protein
VNREELVKKLHKIYVSEELERIEKVVSEIPEKVLGPLHDITKGDNGPLAGDGAPAPGEYKKETKTIIFYENTFNPKVLVHEIGHSIYHECSEITEITNSEYEKDRLHVIETEGEGLSWENGAAEFCANAYQLYKTQSISTDEDPRRSQSLAEKLKEKGL